MNATEDKIEKLLARKAQCSLQVQCLGSFHVWRDGVLLQEKDWGRDRSIQLFQFLITARDRHALHKELIIDRIWEDSGSDQHFKVALHGVTKALEPKRKSRTQSEYIDRQGLSYQLYWDNIWIDAEAMEQLIALGNQALADDPELAMRAYREAIELYQGAYLPNRMYEDWSSAERERLQVLALGVMTMLGELLTKKNPLESIRLSQRALLIDNTWEDAYRIQMRAYLEKGNRPQAIKAYQQCEKVLDEEFGVAPLPETKRLWQEIVGR